MEESNQPSSSVSFATLAKKPINTAGIRVRNDWGTLLVKAKDIKSLSNIQSILKLDNDQWDQYYAEVHAVTDEYLQQHGDNWFTLQGNSSKQKVGKQILDPVIKRWAAALRVAADNNTFFQLVYTTFQLLRQSMQKQKSKSAAILRSDLTILDSDNEITATPHPRFVVSERIAVEFRKYSIEEELAVFVFHINAMATSNPILCTLNELCPSNTESVKIRHVDFDKVKSLLGPHVGSNPYNIYLLLPDSSFNGWRASNASTFRSLATIAFTARVAAITFTVASDVGSKRPAFEEDMQISPTTAKRTRTQTSYSNEDLEMQSVVELRDASTPTPSVQVLPNSQIQDSNILPRPDFQIRQVSASQGSSPSSHPDFQIQQVPASQAQQVSASQGSSPSSHPDFQIQQVSAPQGSPPSSHPDFQIQQVPASHPDSQIMPNPEQPDTFSTEVTEEENAEEAAVEESIHENTESLFAAFKQAVEESSDTDRDRLLMAELTEQADRSRLNEHMEPELWNDVCKFFKRDPGDFTSKTHINGMNPNRFLKPYQLVGVFWMLIHRFSMYGSILADQQGLGKSIQSLVTFLILAWMEWVFDSIKENPSAHSHGKEGCKYAENVRLPFICPCQPQFPKRIKDLITLWGIPRGFQMIIAPANTIFNWSREFDLCFGAESKSHTLPFEFRLTIAHEATKKRREQHLDSVLTQELQYKLGKEPRKGLNGTIVLTTPQSLPTKVINKLQWLKPPSFTIYRKRRVPIDGVPAAFRVSTVFIDECHMVRSKDHGLIQTLRDHKFFPFCGIFPMSGTSWEKGPGDLTIWVNLWEMSWRRRYNDLEQPDKDYPVEHKLPVPGESQATCSHAYKLQSRLDQLRRDIMARKLSVNWDELHSSVRDLGMDIAEFMSLISIRRTEDTVWFNGKKIIKLPPLLQKEEKVEPCESARIVLATIFARTISEIKKVYKRRFKEWKANGSPPGKQPDLNSNMVRKKMYQKRAAATFPNLVNLVKDGVIDGWTLESLKNPNFGLGVNADAALGKSSTFLTSYVPDLMKTSTRARWILKKVSEEVQQCETAAGKLDGEGDGKDKGKNKMSLTRSKKIVILTSIPATAWTMYECLRIELKRRGIKNANGDDVQIRHYAECLQFKDRESLIDAFTDAQKLGTDGEPQTDAHGNPVYIHRDRPDIIIGTAAVLGVGVNLYRASTVIWVEPQYSKSAKDQGDKRVHRIGQLFDCTVYTLLSDNIESERLAANRQEFASMLNTVVNECTREQMEAM